MVFFASACGSGGDGGENGGGGINPRDIFKAAVSYVTDAGPEDLTHGDFDGDGFVDLAVANQIGDTINIFFGDGSGGFQSSITISVPLNQGIDPVSLAVGHFNIRSDMIDDLVVTNFSSDDLSLIFGNPQRNLIKEDVTLDLGMTAGSAPQSVTVGDFSSDGFEDLAIANFGTDVILVLYGDGQGGTPNGIPFFNGNFQGPFDIITGFFNNDLFPDLALVSLSGDNVTIALGCRIGVFGCPSTGFRTPVPYLVGSSPTAITQGDLNGDNFTDLAVANSQDGNVSILLGNGDGTFQDQILLPVGNIPFSIGTGDLDQDGDLDLVVGNQLDNTVSILMGLGNGTFQGQFTVNTQFSPKSVILADLNGDSKLDMAVVNSDSDSLLVFLNVL